LFRVRFLPLESGPGAVAEAAASLLRDVPIVGLNFNRAWCDHARVAAQPELLAQRRRELSSLIGETGEASKR
jgi:hypothetical protein